MHIVNAMFGCGLGGIEQSFLDYCQAIARQGHRVTAIIHPKAGIRPILEAMPGIEVHYVANWGAWDGFARRKLANLLLVLEADAAILHGNRAVRLMRRGTRKVGCKTIGVTHNYSLGRQIGLDAFFATTQDLRNTLIRLGQAEDSIHIIPNMIRLASISPAPHERGEVPVIGAMGRFVRKKGFAVFLDALAELKRRGVSFTAQLGGGGEEEVALKAKAHALGLGRQLAFVGWVQDKRAFFGGIDVFCLPSLHEPFGIVMLEAFAHKVAVVTSDAEGPAEIASSGADALIVPKGDAVALANALERMLKDEALTFSLAVQAEKTVAGYDLDVVGKRICTALEDIIAC